MKKFCFIILHYNEKSLADTFECVESIEISCQKWQNQYQMIIVENGSGDSSARVLKEKYHNQKNIEVVVSQENLGFAKGNNLGCDFAVNNYNPEFLIVINNDTLIKQNQFLELIEKKYNEYKFDVLGPYIYDKKLRPQNPLGNIIYQLSDVEKQIDILTKPIKQLSVKEKVKYFLKKSPMLINFESYLNSLKVGKNAKNEQKNIALHGSALIFSKQYYLKYDDVFYSKTFMFLEENILFYRIKKDDLVSLYSPEIEIYHKEDKSTEATIGNNKSQELWKNKNVLESLEVFKELIESDNRK